MNSVRLIIAALTLACAPAIAADYSPVDITNAEDLAPLAGGKWVLASSMAGGLQAEGGIYAIDTRAGHAHKIYPLGSSAGTSVMPDCAQPVAPTAFAPHGMALQQASGTTRLYVVNHGGREAVEVFEVEPQTPALRWIGCIPAPKGAFGNAVAATSDGTIYMTNMGVAIGGAAAISPMGGDVIAWNAATGWRTVPGSKIVAPNGLLVSPDGQQLFIASWSQGEVIKLTITNNSTTRAVMKPGLLPDNLRWSSNGNILVAGHLATVDEIATCYTAKGRCTAAIPSALVEIDAKSLMLRCTRGTQQNMATVAVEVGRELWVGTARGEKVLRLPGSTFDPAQCKPSAK